MILIMYFTVLIIRLRVARLGVIFILLLLYNFLTFPKLLSSAEITLIIRKTPGKVVEERQCSWQLDWREVMLKTSCLSPPELSACSFNLTHHPPGQEENLSSCLLVLAVAIFYIQITQQIPVKLKGRTIKSNTLKLRARDRRVIYF